MGAVVRGEVNKRGEKECRKQLSVFQDGTEVCGLCRVWQACL